MYTYTPKTLKSQTFVLKGLDINDDPDDILSDFKQHENENLQVTQVTKLKTKNATTSFFLVCIPNNSSVKNLLQIRYVLYRTIRWERIRRDGPTQFYRCQGYGHTSGNCNMHFRCVKCSEEHEPGKCGLKSGEIERGALYCVQCKATGHPASYRGCPKYKEIILRMSEKSKDVEK